jgi:hypothetical protein
MDPYAGVSAQTSLTSFWILPPFEQAARARGWARGERRSWAAGAEGLAGAIGAAGRGAGG